MCTLWLRYTLRTVSMFLPTHMQHFMHNAVHSAYQTQHCTSYTASNCIISVTNLVKIGRMFPTRNRRYTQTTQSKLLSEMYEYFVPPKTGHVHTGRHCDAVAILWDALAWTRNNALFLHCCIAANTSYCLNKCTTFVHVETNPDVLDRLSQISPIPNFTTVRLVAAEMTHRTDGRTDGRTEKSQSALCVTYSKKPKREADSREHPV